MLRPGAAGEPPVSIDLTVVASVPTLTGGDEPGEIDGHPVPAMVVRELAHTLGLLPRPESPERTDTEPTGGEMTCGEVTGGEVAATDLHTACEADQLTSTRHTPPSEGSARERLTSEALTSEALTSEAPTGGPSTSGSAERGDLDPGESAAARLAGLLGIRTIAGTPLAHLPTIAVVEEISGQLLALTDVAGIRGAVTCIRPACRAGRRPCTHPPAGPGLGPPPATDRYTPSTALQRFVRARDRRCRFPGCRAAAIRCDLDHNLPWPAGATAAGNLCCLCRHHHRLSHQAPGWTMHRLPDGGIEWTTPGGDRITTHPPRYGTDGDLPPPTALPTNDEPGRGRPRLTLRERVLGLPSTPEERENDPPPF